MQIITDFLNISSGIIWGPIMLVLLLGTGVYLTPGLRAMPWRSVLDVDYRTRRHGHQIQ